MRQKTNRVSSTYRGMVLLAGVSLAAVLASAPAAAQQTIQMTAIDGYPPKSLWIRTFIDYFIPQVDKELAKSGKY